MNTFLLSLLSFLVLFSLAEATTLKRKAKSEHLQTLICQTGVSLQVSGNYLNIQVSAWSSTGTATGGSVVVNEYQEPSYCVNTAKGLVQNKDSGLYVVAYGNNGYTCFSPNCTPSWQLQVQAVAQIAGNDWPWTVQTVTSGGKNYYAFTLTSAGVVGALTYSNGGISIQTYQAGQANQLWQYVSSY